MRLIEDMRYTSHALLTGEHECTVDCYIHLAGIDVKSEGSIHLQETVIHSHCVFKEICGALHVVREKFYKAL